MKYQIMIDIMMLLLSKRKLSAQEIASRYDISQRSVYRYIDELNLCGVPVDVQRGRYGGISIADTFRLPSWYFTREEYTATINALNAMSSQVSDKSVISALDKLQSQQKLDKQNPNVCGNIIVDGGTWGDSKKFSDKMRVCETAVNERKSLLIDYISREGEHSKRVIDPYFLIFKQNVWYIYSFCHTKQTFRTFKVGRIKQASFTGETFEKKEITRDEINLNFYYNSVTMVDVTLEIEKATLPDAEDWLGMDNIEPRGNKFIARITAPDDGGLVNQILSYGGTVKVLEPLDLREKVRAAAEKILQA
ncbi:MAG: YafY family transcriptional regulator [Clostridia bacterium]|nr:YafY family transcriptional regulator [Clostridia bacterium]